MNGKDVEGLASTTDESGPSIPLEEMIRSVLRGIEAVKVAFRRSPFGRPTTTTATNDQTVLDKPLLSAVTVVDGVDDQDVQAAAEEMVQISLVQGVGAGPVDDETAEPVVQPPTMLSAVIEGTSVVVNNEAPTSLRPHRFFSLPFDPDDDDDEKELDLLSFPKRRPFLPCTAYRQDPVEGEAIERNPLLDVA